MPKQRGFPTTSLLARLDPTDRLPLHRQLYAEIRNAIVGGRIPAGARIPSSRGLAEDLGVSRTTVLQAVDQLRAEGYLTTVMGSGTRVVDVLPEKLTRVRLAAPAVPGRAPAGGLSARGQAIVDTPRSIFRATGDIPAFRLGIPGLDLFPRKVWNRLLIHRARMTSVTELDYGSPPGVPVLREAIARYVASSRGVRCTPEQVIVISGVQHGMGFLARLLLDPGDKAWLEEPAYLAARAALSAASARIVPVPVDCEGLDVAEGIRRAPDARLAFVSPSHQYPLGVTMSLQRRLMLIDWAREANAWILEDDYDSEFRYGGGPLMALQGLDGGSRVIYLGTFSKSVFPALRIGFIVVPQELVEGFARARMLTEQHPPILQQLVLADFIREGHFARHIRRMRRAYEARQDALVTAVHRELGATLALDPTDAGLHMTGYLPPDLPDQEVTREALARGVEVSPLSVHYQEPGRARNGLLMGFASIDEAAIRDGVRRLAQAIDAVARSGAGRWTSAA
ncbi:MAG TPA: PLP-dependent aminotransferase family protein [Longimicrobium sp.]|nr:PLP-dependent aminotransferase family protein [Longimicrobium sp.]